ncbi:MAG: DUF4389 domain-containing protein [Coxiellaceae bacterium]|jgi:hypothetical protein|nr:DUF4389 domain-containing protein [Coxiellaceae bacterium]
MQKDLKEKLLVKAKWVRGLLMLLFVIVKHITSILINLIALFQFVTVLLTDKPNIKLLEFSKNLNSYLLQVISFLVFNSETKPFPFTNWPEN